MKLLILGMGNSILSDDAAGLHAAKMLYDETAGAGGVELKLAETGGMNLLDMIRDYDSLFVIDSIKTGSYPPGMVVEIDFESKIGSHRILSSHDISIFEAVNIGRQTGIKMPETIRIFGIEIINNEEFGEKMSPEIMSKMNDIVKQIKKEILL
ncbi:MAG: hydrogenase maturation protease [Candidatus Goldiibacteriota bacterium]